MKCYVLSVTSTVCISKLAYPPNFIPFIIYKRIIEAPSSHGPHLIFCAVTVCFDLLYYFQLQYVLFCILLSVCLYVIVACFLIDQCCLESLVERFIACLNCLCSVTPDPRV